MLLRHDLIGPILDPDTTANPEMDVIKKNIGRKN